MVELPREIRDRERVPHSLRVGVRRAELPPVAELAAFCTRGAAPSVESGEAWIRVAWEATRERLVVLLEEDRGPAAGGFDHALVVESGASKACFLAAYFIARRCGGVVQVRQRAELLPAAAFAERFLEDEDLEARWGRATSAP